MAVSPLHLFTIPDSSLCLSWHVDWIEPAYMTWKYLSSTELYADRNTNERYRSCLPGLYGKERHRHTAHQPTRESLLCGLERGESLFAFDADILL